MAEETQNVNIANVEENNHQNQNVEASPEIIPHSDRMEQSASNEEAIGQLPNERQMEIPAAKVRSSLAELEMQASQALHRLESIKLNRDANATPLANSNSSSSAGILSADRCAPSDVLSFLESVLVSQITEGDDEESEEQNFLLPALNEVSHLALISHSIIAYLSHLDYRKLSKVTTKISNDTNQWLAHLFRFIDGNASYHNDSTDAILRAVRLAIATRCPGYLEGGVPALANPCLYICENSSQIALQYACRQLGLPINCIRLVPSNTNLGNVGTMDISVLSKIIQNDITSNRTPLFVIGDVGASICGHVDDIQRLQEICRANSVWLHCRGHTLAALAVTQGTLQQNYGQPLRPIADSMSITLGSWLALPNLPVVLLYRPIESAALSVIDADPVLSRRLNSLSLWTSLQAFGRDAIAGKISIAFDFCSYFHNIVSKCEGLRILSKPPNGELNSSLTDLIYKPLNVSLLFESVVPVVVFQFDGNLAAIGPSDTASGENKETSEQAQANQKTMNEQAIINKSIEKVANSSYFDKLNSWLGQNLQRDCPELILEIREHPTYGTCIRFCPFELGLADSIPNLFDWDMLHESLDVQLDILHATVKHKATLIRLVEQSPVLRLVQLYDWAGLGGVRFVPEGWETWLTDQAKTELNKLNADLVEALRATDNAFSLGEGPDGLICVRFGMVTEDTDVEELLDLVISVGRSVQENSRVLDTMSEIVKKGIEAATADLQRESDEKLWADGIFRNVPVVGSVVNWWSPPTKETGIKGRSLNLTQGVVESTENIYKYHMQLTNSQQQIQGTTKTTPQPMIQTAVSTGHSRQSSATSTTTHCDQQQTPKTETNNGQTKSEA